MDALMGAMQTQGAADRDVGPTAVAETLVILDRGASRVPGRREKFIE